MAKRYGAKTRLTEDVNGRYGRKGLSGGHGWRRKWTERKAVRGPGRETRRWTDDRDTNGT